MIVSQAIKSFKVVYSLKKISGKNIEKRRKAAKYLFQLFGNERGLFFKLGQALGLRKDSLEEFENLTLGDVDTISFFEIKKYLNENVGGNSELPFSSISQDGISASIAQVHRAKLLDGTDVAIKIQIPGIRKQIEDQLTFLNMTSFLEKIGPLKKWGIDLAPYRDSISNILNEELSYFKEGANTLRMKNNFKNNTKVKIPNVFSEISTDTVLVQEWISGENFREVCHSWGDSDKRAVAEVLVSQFFDQIFSYNFFQRDPHKGNFIFYKSNLGRVRLGMIDFGNCGEIERTQAILLARLGWSLSKASNDNYLGLMEGLGFDFEKLKHIEAQLPLVLRSIFEPLCYNHAFDLETWNPIEKVNLILSDYKWWFRSSGSPAFFSLMKSFLGITSIVRGLGIRINWQKLFYIHSLTLMTEANKLKLRKMNEKLPSFQSENICIEVIKNGEKKVMISLPSTGLIELNSLIEPDIKQKLKKRGIEINDLIFKACQNGGAPQSIFELVEKNKIYRVFLK